MKTLLAATMAGLMVAGSAAAADSVRTGDVRIESEAQFVRDYGDQIEQAGPGVYQVVKGPLAGKTVTIGEAGLTYDMRVQHILLEQEKKAGRSGREPQAALQALEATRNHYATFRAQEIPGFDANRAASGVLFCTYWPAGAKQPINYSGSANVAATTELYLDNGGGGLNFYYARAIASANGYVYRPFNVPSSLSFVLYAYTINRQTTEAITRTGGGYTSGGISTGYVYSGPAFGHDLYAVSSVSGTGNCAGYVSISDTLQM